VLDERLAAVFFDAGFARAALARAFAGLRVLDFFATFFLAIRSSPEVSMCKGAARCAATTIISSSPRFAG
jgi:hypothetical protein